MAFDRSPQKVVYRLSLRALPSFRLPRERYYYRYREPPLSQPSARFRRYIRQSCCAHDRCKNEQSKLYHIFKKSQYFFEKNFVFCGFSAFWLNFLPPKPVFLQNPRFSSLSYFDFSVCFHIERTALAHMYKSDGRAEFYGYLFRM